MASVRIVVPGRPRGKAVARVGFGRGYTPTPTRDEMETARYIALHAMQGQPPFAGPVALRLCAYMPVPVSWSRLKRASALAGELHPTGKPDGSNIQKLIEDAVLRVVINDDSQIVQWQGSKVYSDDARVVFEISEVQAHGKNAGEATR